MKYLLGLWIFAGFAISATAPQWAMAAWSGASAAFVVSTVWHRYHNMDLDELFPFLDSGDLDENSEEEEEEE